MKALLPFVVLALPTLLAAQASYVVLPKGMEKVQGANYDNSYLGRGGKNRTGTVSYVPMHIQTGYALAELGRSALQARTLSYRRNNWQRDWMWKSTQTLAIHMSHSPLAPMLYTATFASNEGKIRTQVFGKGGKPAVLNWPAAQYVFNGSRPVPFALKIPLASPYVVIRASGKSLCIDFSISKRVSTYTFGANTYNANLFLDAAGLPRGGLFENGLIRWKCKFSNGRYPWGLSYSFMSLTTQGGPWYLSYNSIPKGLVGVATLSGFGVLTKPNPFKLPIDLTSIGAPGCYWKVGLETGIWVALTSDTTNRMIWPRLTIPKGIAPGSFYDQCLILDPKANKAGIVVTPSNEWRIVQAGLPNCVTVYKHQDTTPPAKAGSIRRAFAAIIRLDS